MAEVEAIKVQELGWCTARHFQDDVLESKGRGNFLLIFSPSSITEMIASPASDVRISGKANICKLRDFLNQIYPQKED